MTATISFGITDSGDALVKDLGDIKNLIITGHTGCGKSVLLKSIVRSVAAQSGNKILLIDTKAFDFTGYESACLIRPVINDVDDAMDCLMHIDVSVDDDVVIVIDELSDLIAATNGTVENVLTDLAQNPRVHIIAATGRADLLSPGFIKNFYTGVSFNDGQIGDAIYSDNDMPQQIHIKTTM